MNIITTRNLHQFTEQEVFDFICRKVIEQGVPAMEDISCKYLTADGKKCAAGHLMLEQDLKVLKAKGSVDVFIGSDFKVLGWEMSPFTISPFHLGLISSLQNAHDGSSMKGDWFLSEFKRMALDVATNRNLNPSILN